MGTTRQLLTYAAVGLASNAALYALYLWLTGLGMGHKTAMTGLFALGVLWTYLGNRRWTFRHRGGSAPAFRYAASYLLAYLANIGSLFLLVDIARLPHRAVMLVLIVITACGLFASQKYWVFSHSPGGAREGGEPAA
jgi:putative flippase GtrA